MHWTDLLITQFTDPFRIGLLVALMLTMRNTQRATGTVIPALAGIVFVAAIIPMSLTSSQPFWPQFATGLFVNAVIIGVLTAAVALFRRFAGR